MINYYFSKQKMKNSKGSVVLIYKMLEACKFIQNYIKEFSFHSQEKLNVQKNMLLAMIAYIC